MKRTRRILRILPVALLPLLAILPATRGAAGTLPSPRCLAERHWGRFFGDGIRGTGDYTLVPRRMVIPVTNGCTTQVGSSNSTEYALLSNGTLWAWGQGTYGELGDGKTVNSFSAPVQVKFPSGVKIASIPTDAMPFDTGLAIDTSGHLWGWGLNKGGELCTGTKSMYTRPLKLIAFTAPVTFVAGADQHLITDAHNKIESCGANTAGVLGDGGRAGVTSPVEVQRIGGDGARVAELTSSYDDAGVLLSDGAYWDWGYNAEGQVGNGGTTAVRTPFRVRIGGGTSPVKQVAQGGSDAKNGQVLALLANGSTWAWGDNHWHQLGTGSTTPKLRPVQFSAPAGATYTQLASGGQTSYAVDSGGNVWAWGDGTFEEIGDGSRAVQPTPVKVLAGATLISSTAYNVVAGK